MKLLGGIVAISLLRRTLKTKEKDPLIFFLKGTVRINKNQNKKTVHLLNGSPLKAVFFMPPSHHFKLWHVLFFSSFFAFYNMALPHSLFLLRWHSFILFRHSFFTLLFSACYPYTAGHWVTQYQCSVCFIYCKFHNKKLLWTLNGAKFKLLSRTIPSTATLQLRQVTSCLSWSGSHPGCGPTGWTFAGWLTEERLDAVCHSELRVTAENKLDGWGFVYFIFFLFHFIFILLFLGCLTSCLPVILLFQPFEFHLICAQVLSQSWWVAFRQLIFCSSLLSPHTHARTHSHAHSPVCICA